MKRIVTLGAGLLALGGGAALFLNARGHPELPQSSAAFLVLRASASPLPAVSPPVAAVRTQTAAEAREAATRKVNVSRPPSSGLLRQQAQADLHAVPSALLQYGAQLGRRMEAAKVSQDEARTLLGELQTCVSTDQGAPVQARALCLFSARKLGKIWPDLGDQVGQITHASDAATTKLAGQLER